MVAPTNAIWNLTLLNVYTYADGTYGDVIYAVTRSRDPTMSKSVFIL